MELGPVKPNQHGSAKAALPNDANARREAFGSLIQGLSGGTALGSGGLARLVDTSALTERRPREEATKPIRRDDRPVQKAEPRGRAPEDVPAQEDRDINEEQPTTAVAVEMSGSAQQQMLMQDAPLPDGAQKLEGGAAQTAAQDGSIPAEAASDGEATAVRPVLTAQAEGAAAARPLAQQGPLQTQPSGADGNSAQPVLDPSRSQPAEAEAANPVLTTQAQSKADGAQQATPRQANLQDSRQAQDLASRLPEDTKVKVSVKVENASIGTTAASDGEVTADESLLPASRGGSGKLVLPQQGQQSLANGGQGTGAGNAQQQQQGQQQNQPQQQQQDGRAALQPTARAAEQVAQNTAARGGASAQSFTQLLQQNGGGDGLTAAQGSSSAARAGGEAAQPNAPRETARPQVAQQVSVQIKKAIANGDSNIRIQLKPADLGRVDVQLKMKDGRVSVIVTADNQKALDMLQQDSRGLERALQDAGLKTDSNSLQFNMRGEGGNGFAKEGENQKDAHKRLANLAGEDEDVATNTPVQNKLGGDGRGVDIRV